MSYKTSQETKVQTHSTIWIGTKLPAAPSQVSVICFTLGVTAFDSQRLMLLSNIQFYQEM
jgi:hypothetical protein